MSHSPTDTPPEGMPGWEPVPRGTLVAAARQHRWRTRSRQLSYTAGLLVAAVGIGWVWLQQPTAPDPRGAHFGGIWCSEVQPLLPQYIRRQLAAELHDRIEAHLIECAHCRERWQRMEIGQTTPHRNPVRVVTRTISNPWQDDHLGSVISRKF